ncbi:MarR family winged helix-turn-helix transcriptional regulator [Luteimonas saliphila]|uniref:MarR family winged helix-turn-helix transcriptional regulator n=1 Tax=Luteimonas saliphila TaxID=2804919 RepID=UPI00192DDAEC|nr:MarR family transcriptional regulator [Luteimonas saliphila]
MNHDSAPGATTRGESAEQLLLATLEQQIHLLARGLASDDLRVGFTPREWNVLTQLVNDSGLSLTALAERTELNMSTASRILQKLASHGLVDWNRLPESQRTYAIRITPAGRQRYAAAKPRASTGTRAAVEQLSREELSTIVGILGRCLERRVPDR